MTGVQFYSFGASPAEMVRLDGQATSIATATKLVVAKAGITTGMRVLDLGTGRGHVAFSLSEVVGPVGQVVGIDQAAALLEVAEQRRTAAGIDNVSFVEADVRAYWDSEPFDAVVGRLVLFHLGEPVEVLRHRLGGLAEGGVMLMIDFDVGSVLSETPVPLFHAARDWVIQAFRHAGADPVVGTRLGLWLRDVGLTDVDGFGRQQYDPAGPALLAVVRSPAPVIVTAGIATEQELALDSLEARLAHDLQANQAVGLLPAVVGSWGRKRSRDEESRV